MPHRSNSMVSRTVTLINLIKCDFSPQSQAVAAESAPSLTKPRATAVNPAHLLQVPVKPSLHGQETSIEFNQFINTVRGFASPTVFESGMFTQL